MSKQARDRRDHVHRYVATHGVWSKDQERTEQYDHDCDDGQVLAAR
jgi:hypothetical protein